MSGRPGGIVWLLFWLFAMCCSQVHALPSNIVTVAPLAEQMDLSESMALLRDPGSGLGFKEALARIDEFQPASRQELITSFNAGAFWLHVSLINRSSEPLTRWLVVGTAKTQSVTFHLRQDDGWLIFRSGRNVARLDKPIITLAPVFPVSLLPGKQLDLLLRIDSRGATDMATALWEPQAYHYAVSKQQMHVAALLGGLVISSVLALIVFARLREMQYFWLGMMMMSVAGLEASRENFLGTYLWPAHLTLPPQSLAMFAVIALFSLSKVASYALELVERMPIANLGMLALRWIAAVGALIALYSYGHGVRIISLVSVAQNLAMLLLSLLAWHRKQPNAQIFLLAFSLALLVETTRQLANLGVLPWIDAMTFSTLFFLLASPLILLGLIEQTHRLSEKLQFAEELQEAKSAFLARVNHELRSPLNTILGYSRMLARGSSRLGLAEGTTGIEKSALRLLRLIDELLDEARVAAGQLSVRPAALDLQPWLEEIAQTARVNIESKSNRLLCEFSGNLAITIEADGERLRQVLDNLLSNANRHTAQGTIRFECTTMAGEGVVSLKFAIHDDGEGINAERLRVIFEPFVRGDTRSVGHGLGLSICRELVRQMGGDIAVVSSLGRGSSFTFSLSCPLIMTKGLPRQATCIPVNLGTPPSDRPKVFLIDDDVAHLNQLEALLVDAGFEVGGTLSGNVAIEQLVPANCDVVITDQLMPVADGWSVLRQLRAAKPALPVILLSSATPFRPVGFPANLGFDATLLKSASSADILATVWYVILKSDAEKSSLDWSSLEHFANEGDVSGIEDWIAAHSSAIGASERTLRWVGDNLKQLNLHVLEQFAGVAATASRSKTATVSNGLNP